MIIEVSTGDKYTVVVSSPTSYSVVVTDNVRTGPRGYGVANNGIIGQILLSNGGYDTFWSNVNLLSVNNSLYFDGLPSSAYVNTSQLSSNVADLREYANGLANSAYSNAVSYVDNKLYANTLQVTSNAATAYSNAVIFASNASNINTGTVNASLLQDSGVVANTYGNSSSIPVITIDNKGRITVATTNAVAGLTSLQFFTANNTLRISTSDGSNYFSSLNIPRVTGSNTTTQIQNNASSSINIEGYKTYILQKVQTSAPSRVRIYTDSNSRTNDANRDLYVEPVSGSGLIAEVVTSNTDPINITPTVVGFNNDVTPSNTIYLAVTNYSGVSSSITVTLTFLQLEA